MKGSCVVTGVVLTLAAEEEVLGWSEDVAVTGWRVKQRIVKFQSIIREFLEDYSENDDCSRFVLRAMTS